MTHLDTPTHSKSYLYEASYDPASYAELRKRNMRWQLIGYLAVALWLVQMANALFRGDFFMTVVTTLVVAPLVGLAMMIGGIHHEYHAAKRDFDFVHKMRQFAEKWMRDAKSHTLTTSTLYAMHVMMSSEKPDVLQVEVRKLDDEMYVPMQFEIGDTYIGTLQGADPKSVFPPLRHMLLGEDIDSLSATLLEHRFARLDPQVDPRMREAISLQSD